MGKGVLGANLARTRHRGLTIACVKFTGAAAAPTTYTDGTGILDATTPFSHATGTYTLNLRDDWDAIYVIGVCMTGTTDHDSVVLEATDETVGSQSVTVRAEAAGTADDQVGEVFHVTLGLFLSDDA